MVSRALLLSPELINWALLPRALLGLLALLCGNGYIVGINQARARLGPPACVLRQRCGGAAARSGAQQR